MKYRGRVKVTGKRQITLPAEMCRDLGIVRGDELEIERVEGGLWIKPAMAAPAPDWRDDPIWKLCGAFSSKEPGDVATHFHDWAADAAAHIEEMPG
jgi:AbrB family looped-hinge helix DNA binding protein